VEPVSALRERCMAGLARLPEKYRQINKAAVYPVRYTKRLTAMRDAIKKRVRRFAIK
jgi:hypothetical protein